MDLDKCYVYRLKCNFSACLLYKLIRTYEGNFEREYFDDEMINDVSSNRRFKKK
jgi:hypothetical protein